MQNTLIDRADLLSLTDAAKRLPGRPHRATVWRWARRGITTARGRVRLDVVRLGRAVYVAPEAIIAFSRALAEADSQQFTPSHTTPPSKKTSRAEQAEREADALGI